MLRITLLHSLLMRQKKKKSEVETSVKHSSLTPEGPGNMQAVSRLVVTAQMGLLSCPCLSHSVDMSLSAGYTALCKHTLVRWRDKQQSRWNGTTLPTPAVSLKYGKVFWRSIQSIRPQTDFVLCKVGSFIWKPVHESVMNRFHSEGAMKKRSYFWFR